MLSRDIQNYGRQRRGEFAELLADQGNFDDLILGGPVVDVRKYHASGSAQQTEGWMAVNSRVLNIDSAIDFQNGQGIRVVGAGEAGADLVTVIEQGAGSATLWLRDNAETGIDTVAKTEVYHDDSEAIQAAVDSIPFGGGCVMFPPGSFRVALQINNTQSFVLFKSVGHLASKVYVESDITVFLANSLATATGDYRAESVSFKGLHFVGSSKNATAIEMRDVRRSYIEDCRFEGFRGTGGAVKLTHRDNINLNRCSFFDNDFDITNPQFFSNTLSQTWYVTKCHFSSTNYWSIYVDSDWADILIDHCSFAGVSVGAASVPKGNIRIRNGVDSSGSGFRLRDSTFEKVGGNSDTYFVYFYNPDNKNANDVLVSGCSFFGGAMSAIIAERVVSCTIERSRFGQTLTDGGVCWHFDSDCLDVLLSNLRYSSGSPGTRQFDCNRNEIFVEPSVVWFQDPRRSLNYYAATLADGSGGAVEVAIDVETEFSVELPVPAPKTWIFNLMVSDSGSFAAAANNCYILIRSDLAISTNEVPWLNISGVPDGNKVGMQLMCGARTAWPGTLYLRFRNTGVGAMSIWLSLRGYIV